MKSETEVQITREMMVSGFPCGTCYRNSAEFLENAGTFEIEELNGRYQVRYLGFGYFLATPEGMEESARTEAEHENFGPGVENIARPFVFRNTEWNHEYNQEILAF